MVKTLAFAIAALTFAPFLRAQIQSDAGSAIIHVETREVPVDVTVTGKKGSAAGEMTAKDFSIWEDGKPQKINSVVAASANPETSLKHFVLYFDFSTMPMSDQIESENAATDFVEGLASPDRYMAVMSMTPAGPRVLQDFTVETAALKNAVSKVQSAFGNRPFSAQSDGLSDSLTTVCRSMSPATGRKALLLFTGGHSDFRGAIPEAFKASVAACNRANVAMYVIAANSSSAPDLRSVGPRGTGTVVSQPTAEDTSATFAQLLAGSTGGESLSLTGSLKDQLAAVAREQDDYYRIFYTPPPAKEGSCHTLRVATNIHGLNAKARNEYCTERPVDLVAGKVAGQTLESATGKGALNATIQLPYFYSGTNRASVHLSVDFVPAGMKFEKGQKGLLEGQIEIVGTATRPDGGTAARFADTRIVNMESQQSADAFTRSPYHYEEQFNIAPGTYTFQLALGAGPNAIAKVEAPLKVDPWTSGSFGIGGIAFSTESLAVDTMSASPVSAAPILEGHAPLIVGAKQFVPAATNRFRRSDAVAFYTEFYAPSTALTMQYCIQDRKTGELKGCSSTTNISNYIHPGSSVVPFATHLPAVAQLPAGSYTLEVRGAIPSTQQTVSRTIDFELN